MRKLHVLALVAGAASATFLVTQALAGTATLPPPATTISGGPITAVRVVRGELPLPIGTHSTTYVAVKGASTSITVPPHSHALILASFNAMSECRDQASGGAGNCLVKITLRAPNGHTIEGKPSGRNVFDGKQDIGGGNYAPSPEGHRSMDRSWGPVGPGTYTVRVLHAVNNGATTYFGIYGYELTVERINA